MGRSSIFSAGSKSDGCWVGASGLAAVAETSSNVAMFCGVGDGAAQAGMPVPLEATARVPVPLEATARVPVPLEAVVGDGAAQAGMPVLLEAIARVPVLPEVVVERPRMMNLR